jgi:zinc transport system ATP-binding protein
VMDNVPAIEIERVSFSYDGLPVLDDVSFTVPRQDFTSLVGPNGGGKTTLIKLMLGLLQPQQGVVRIFGERPERVRHRIGYVPQYFNFDALFPIRVQDVVLMGELHESRWLGPYRRREREAASDALREVDLVALRDRPFFALSGGQRQRVLVARALVSRPELLLLDEPTANLDVRSENEVYDLIRALSRRLTVVLATHDIGFVSAAVKSVVCVKNTVVVHPTSELTGELIREIFGGDMRLVRHDHRCAEGGHEWESS